MTDHIPEESPPAQSGSPQRAAGMDARQRELHAELSEIHPELGGLYRIALSLLEDDREGTAHVIGYLGRELSNGIMRELRSGNVRPTRGEEPPDRPSHPQQIGGILSLPPTDPRVRLWYEAHGVLHAATHVRGVHQTPPELDDVREAFALLENVLRARVVGLFFDSLERLDQLLAKEMPDPSDVEEVKGLLLTPAQRLHFFRELSGPGWLQPLQRAGMLDAPPRRLEHDDGSWRAVAWPEGIYLARVADTLPDDVVQVVSSQDHGHDNPGVWRGLLDIMEALPEAHAAKLAELLNGPIDGGHVRFLAPDLLTQAVRLAVKTREVVH